MLKWITKYVRIRDLADILYTPVVYAQILVEMTFVEHQLSETHGLDMYIRIKFDSSTADEEKSKLEPDANPA